jgi:hypothetical protein
MVSSGMALTAAEKMRRHRARRRDGVVVLPIAVDVDMLAEFLIDRGFIMPWDADDRAAIAKALATALDVWVRA